VLVHKFICRGTVEERIDAMIREKSRLASDVIGEQSPGAEALMTEWDNDTLLRFVKLDLPSSIADEQPPKE
jgi:SNF2 family DNA or RNA helicase